MRTSFIIILWFISSIAQAQDSVLSFKVQLENRAKYFEKLYSERDGDVTGTGYKQFFRDYQFVMPRLDKLGSLNEYVQAIKLNEEKLIAPNKTYNQIEEGDWTFLGPKGYPLTPDPLSHHSSNGKGWIKCIWVDPMNHDRIYAGANRGGLWYIQGYELTAGMYYYSLVVYDLLSGTEKMVLTD